MIKISNNNTYYTPVKKNCAEAIPQSQISKVNDDINLNYHPSSQYARAILNIQSKENVSELSDKFQACLLGGAIGDAVGRPVERVRINDIKDRYGDEGIQDMQTVGLKGRVTDDTQLTIFTADGLIKSDISGKSNNEEPDYDIIYNSYKDWYKTQTEGLKNKPEKLNTGWIGEMDELYYSGGAGPTCLGSLKEGKMGTIENPINESKSCGAAMRVAPVGLKYHNNPELAFNVAAKCGAMTHSAPEAYLPAGFLGAVIAHVTNGKSIEEAVDKSLEILQTKENSESTYDLISLAKLLAKNDNISPDDAIPQIGKGWRGDEAIAISVYCALKEPQNFKKAVLIAVNHDGDSDSTGSMVGNILGASLGSSHIPENWKNNIEMSEEIKAIAHDLNNPKGYENFYTCTSLKK